MNEPLPREPNPENIPIAVPPHGPLTLTKRGYLLLAGGGVIVLMMAYGSCHQPQQGTYGPVRPGSRTGDLEKAEKARKEYEEMLQQLKEQARGQKHGLAGTDEDGYRQQAQPQKTLRQTQEEDLAKRLHDAAYAVPLVTDAAAKHSDDRPALATNNPSTDTSHAHEKSDEPQLDTMRTVTLAAGTVLNAETVNMIDAANAGPLVAMISRDVYAPGTKRVVIPQGARLFGEVARVSGLDQERVSVTFHRMTVGTHTVSLDKLPGLDQQGATGLHDQVNHHYVQIFGVSMAIGALGGLAQVGNGSYGGLQGYDATTQIRNGITNSFATSAGMVLNRFLQRMPTIRIRPGQRVDVLLMEDLKIPDVLE